MSHVRSHFVTPTRRFVLHGISTIVDQDRQNFRDGSWYRRLVAVRPGPFVLPAPKGPNTYDPLPPAKMLKHEPMSPRRYLGRITEILEGTLVLKLWEVPNAREIIANVVRKAAGVTTRGRLVRGTPVTVWTWQEVNGDGQVLERIHLESLEPATSKRRKGASR